MTYVMEGIPETDFPAEPDNIKEYLVPPPTDVPVVVGLEQKEAEDLLQTEKRLNVTVIEVASLEPVGIVVNQSHEPGSTVRQGTFITIYVSTGEIPKAPLVNFVGLTMEEALELVRTFELETGVKLSVVQQKVEVNDANLVGKIVSTNPPPGTELVESAVVSLMVGELAQGNGG
jgi:serine/threonine-protein kinase